MKFFYSAGSMGYGNGYWWHRFFDFPKFPFVTKTLTSLPKKGNKYLIIPDFKGSIYNRVALDNIGISDFLLKYGANLKDRTISLAGSYDDINYMMDLIYLSCDVNKGYKDEDFFDDIELNFSCPNVKSFNNKKIPPMVKNIYLKLNWTQDPYVYDLGIVKGIRLNSVPLKFCGGSGKIAQKKNWEFIEKYNKEGLNVAGCSIQNMQDIKRLEDIGCKEIGIGSVMLTHPRVVESLGGLIC